MWGWLACATGMENVAPKSQYSVSSAVCGVDHRSLPVLAQGMGQGSCRLENKAVESLLPADRLSHPRLYEPGQLLLHSYESFYLPID